VDNGFDDDVVSKFPTPDHCSVSLDQMLKFCEEVKAWFTLSDDNVAVIHCQAGKGRTGVMISALLIYSGAVASAEDALAWFALYRGNGTVDGGVTIPSQKRCLVAFEQYLKQSGTFISNPLVDPPLLYKLSSIRFGPIKQAEDPWFCMSDPNRAVEAKLELVTRDSVLSKQGDRFVFKNLFLPLDDEECIELQLPKTDDSGKQHVWRTQDGRIKVTFSNGPESHTFSSWWTHATLQRQGEFLCMVRDTHELDKHTLPARSGFKLKGKFQEFEAN